MKKVGIILQNIGLGGIDSVTIAIANKLSETYEIDLIVLLENEGNYNVNENINISILNLKYNFFEKVVRKISRKYECKYKKEIKNLKKYFNNKYDIVIASDGSNTMLLNQLDLPNTKKIGWMHNEYNTYMNNYYSAFKKNFCMSLRNMDNLVVLTKQDQEQYQKHNLKTKAIYNPLTISKSKVSDLKSKEILFVGRLAKEQKGLDLLLDIIGKTQLNDWKLRIVGEGSDLEWLKTEIGKRNLTDKVILHGAVQENIQDIYANASVFVSTSRWEGFGLVITEAMSCGLPVIAFENAGPKEILDNGKYGILVQKQDTDTFAKELSRLIESKNELERYQKLSLQRSEEFKIDKIIQEWEAIINEE